jgi:hypothetical protein
MVADRAAGLDRRTAAGLEVVPDVCATNIAVRESDGGCPVSTSSANDPAPHTLKSTKWVTGQPACAKEGCVIG